MSILAVRQPSAGTNGSATTAAAIVPRKQGDVQVTALSRRVAMAALDVAADARVVERQASAMLRSSSYQPVRRVQCEVHRRVLVLRGRVPSYHMKQMAQTVVRELLRDGMALDNQVEVDRT